MLYFLFIFVLGVWQDISKLSFGWCTFFIVTTVKFCWATNCYCKLQSHIITGTKYLKRDLILFIHVSIQKLSLDVHFASKSIKIDCWFQLLLFNWGRSVIYEKYMQRAFMPYVRKKSLWVLSPPSDFREAAILPFIQSHIK